MGKMQVLGLQTSQDARFYAASARFEPFSNEGKTLVIQFTVKHEQKIDCGGGYVKVFPAALEQTEMHGESSYYIMFGPDICGYSTKKVHVIFNYKGKNHLIKKEIKCKDDELTHLYTLILNPDQTYEVKIDNEKVESGSLEEDWDFLAPKKIKDPEAKKPEDWDDRAKIDDADDTKPEEWDKPENIPDPDAKKPEDWDEDMDGEWEPPMIPNPEYKGEWKPKQIDNPNYKGAWVHPEIDNPEYSADSNIYKFDSISVLGLDLWQVKSGTIFDNFLITDDVKEAEDIGNVWFQNRRAKWRRQEKMDTSTMKLHDSPMLSFNRPPMPPSVGPVANPMPLDPWLTSPISSATPMHTIPGFMGSPQGLQPAYPSHSFLNTSPGMVQGMQPMGPPPYQCPPSFNDKYPMEDDRSSSIAALRMKAKEHIQSMDKTWQHM